MADLTQKEFKLFKDYIFEIAGISLSDQKVSLLKSRLSKRLRKLGLETFTEYYEYVTHGHDDEIPELLNAITTNVTSFFREPIHWKFLEEYCKSSEFKDYNRKLRIWSSASSTGQEPYTIAMALQEYIPDISQWDIKILATDMDTQVLAKAQSGVYTTKEVGDLSPHYLRHYFETQARDHHIDYRVKKKLRDQVLYRSFNLVRGNYKMFRKPFDIIFCRNVMIYFDRDTRDELVKHFYDLLPKGGLLFIGHSESITKNLEYFELIKPSIYRRK